MPSPIFVTGMMASGKTTVGRLLARGIGAEFVDLDARIERMFGRTIVELFAEGEPRFRALERLALRSLVDEPGFAGRSVVVSTGGGVVVDPENRDLMAAHGTVVFLDVPLDELVERLGQAGPDTATRPLVAGADLGLRRKMAELLTTRRHAYLDRSLPIDGGDPPEAVVARISAALCDEHDDRDSEAV